jgi:phospholipase C
MKAGRPTSRLRWIVTSGLVVVSLMIAFVSRTGSPSVAIAAAPPCTSPRHVEFNGTALSSSSATVRVRVDHDRSSTRTLRSGQLVTIKGAPSAQVLRERVSTVLTDVQPGDQLTISGDVCRSATSLTISARRVFALAGIHRLQHLVFIMQENRSFDEYFGMYPGVDGIPRQNGQFTVCNPDPATGTCVAPYHDSNDQQIDLAHGAQDAVVDIDGGKMDGFIRSDQAYRKIQCKVVSPDPSCADPDAAAEAMGYKLRSDIPNYWAYANSFVLQDHMFEPNLGWSLPAHLFMVSGWSAQCSNPSDAMTCHTELNFQTQQTLVNSNRPYMTASWGWTDITYLLHKYNVSWGYYVDPGSQPDCDDGLPNCAPVAQNPDTPAVWNPLPDFVDVHQDAQLESVQGSDKFFAQAKSGTLPRVAWVVPNKSNSEHAGALVSTGEKWVTSLVNAVMQGPDWSTTAIFISWDDWGGFYDHVVPPRIDASGYGIRVPGLLISPYARKGYVDDQTLSFDAYLRLIEDDFMGGQRLDPATDGRPDPRPGVREVAPQLGNLVSEFDFAQRERKPMLLTPR